MGIKKALLKSYLFVFCRNSLKEFNRLLIILGLKGQGITNYQDELGGEERFIKDSKKVIGKSPVIFDVGANQGEYAKICRKNFPGAEIFCFEPVKKTFKELNSKATKLNLNAFNFGLSDKEETKEIYFEESSKIRSHATVYEDVIRDMHRENSIKKETAKFETLDYFCEQNNVEKIDLLKIDVEGHEYEVLKGAKHMLDSGNVKMIQFEYNEMNLISRKNIYDFFKILQEYDFYRIGYNGLIRINEPDIENKIFLYQNIVAIKKK